MGRMNRRALVRSVVALWAGHGAVGPMVPAAQVDQSEAPASVLGEMPVA